MFYPRLFEEYEETRDIDVSHIPFTDLRDNVIGVKKKYPIQVDDSDYLYKVAGKNPEDKITWQDLLDAKSDTYSNKLKSYVSDVLDIDVKDEIAQIKKIRKRKTGDPNYLPDTEIDLYYGDFWENEIEGYEEKETTQKETERKINIDLDSPEYSEVKEFFTDRGKINDLTEFVINMPQTGGIAETLKDFLSTLNRIIKGEKKEVKIGTNKYLQKKDYSSWKDDMVDFIYEFESPGDLNEIYKEEILKKNTFMNYLFNLEPKGVGRGEFMLAYTIPYARVSGGSEDYDIVVPDPGVYEVKDYSSTGSVDSIRLGTHGKLSQFEFFQEIKNSVKVAKKIMENMGPEALRKVVGKYNFQYWKNMTTQENFTKNSKAIPSSVNSGELTPARLKIIIDWHFLNHLLIEEGIEDRQEYTTAILRGNNMKPQMVKIDPLTDKDLKDGKSVKISGLEDQEKMFNELKSLKYIRDPHQLVEDLENSPKKYFDTIHDKFEAQEGDIEFYFLVFRKDEIKILGSEDFNLATITQSAIKISEVGSKKSQLSAIQSAFKDYKNLKDKDADKEDFWNFYRKKSTNESYYPRLANY